MLDSSRLSRLSPQRRASFIRETIVRYLTKLNQLLPGSQSYDEPVESTHSDGRLAALVDFGLSNSGSPFAGLTPTQANLIVMDATGRYSKDLRHSSTWHDEHVASRMTRHITTDMIRKQTGLSRSEYEREMITARRTILANLGAA